MLESADALQQADFAALGIGFFAGLVLVIGTLTNIVAGCLAYKRHEFLGGRIAALGITVWLLTITSSCSPFPNLLR
jgi:hypothetical protein